MFVSQHDLAHQADVRGAKEGKGVCITPKPDPHRSGGWKLLSEVIAGEVTALKEGPRERISFLGNELQVE